MCHRWPATCGGHMPGRIVMGTGTAIRRAHRVLGAFRAASAPALGYVVQRHTVDPVSATTGEAEIKAGRIHCSIIRDGRGRQAPP